MLGGLNEKCFICFNYRVILNPWTPGEKKNSSFHDAQFRELQFSDVIFKTDPTLADHPEMNMNSETVTRKGFLKKWFEKDLTTIFRKNSKILRKKFG